MYQQLQKTFYNIPAIFKNPFLIVAVIFLVWMLCLDENNMLVQFRRRKELADLSKKRQYYQSQIQSVAKQYEEITSNTESQAKYARENYLMKKDNEDIFVIVAR